MTWCDSSNDGSLAAQRNSSSSTATSMKEEGSRLGVSVRACPSCGHIIQCKEQAGINDLPGLPAGVKFDPTDQELLEHLEGKMDARKQHPLIDEFIPTLDGENGICYTHPHKLPGVNMDGLVRHFFHRPSRAYTTGTRKRRKVHTDAHGGETRWHKTGKTRPILASGRVKGYKKILVLYTNYGKQKKPEKTSWVMHQYHLGLNEEENDGELVVSKVFYQTQPRQCATGLKDPPPVTAAKKTRGFSAAAETSNPVVGDANAIQYYNPPLLHYGDDQRQQLMPDFSLNTDGSAFLHGMEG